MFRKHIIIPFYFYASLRGCFNKDLHHVLLRRARMPLLLSSHSEWSEGSSITNEGQKRSLRENRGHIHRLLKNFKEKNGGYFINPSKIIFNKKPIMATRFMITTKKSLSNRLFISLASSSILLFVSSIRMFISSIRLFVSSILLWRKDISDLISLISEWRRSSSRNIIENGSIR